LVGSSNHYSFNIIKISQLGSPVAAFAIFTLNVPEILNGIFGEVGQVMLNLGFFIALVFDILIGFERIEFRNPFDLYLGKP
jgi:hypothetical protein